MYLLLLLFFAGQLLCRRGSHTVWGALPPPVTRKRFLCNTLCGRRFPSGSHTRWGAVPERRNTGVGRLQDEACERLRRPHVARVLAARCVSTLGSHKVGVQSPHREHREPARGVQLCAARRTTHVFQRTVANTATALKAVACVL